MVELRKVNNLSEMVFYFIICQTDHSLPKHFRCQKTEIRNEHEYIQYTGNEHGLWKFLIHLHSFLENTNKVFPV